MGLALVVAALPWGGNLALGNTGPAGVTFYANSPSGPSPIPGRPTTGTALRKFVDALPGLGPTNANLLGQYIPVATKNTTSYPGSDYYDLGVQLYTKKVHTDLPLPTHFRGYVDLGVATPDPQYLGPLIVAQRDRPVRIRLTKTSGHRPSGHLFVPVDITLMGAGEGLLVSTAGQLHQNRISIHLHGAHTPWNSDGTPRQWFTPPEKTSPYPRV